MRRISDEMLMAGYASGDEAAFRELFDRYEQRVYRYFLRRTRAEDRAQDLYQEVFVRLHRFRGRYDATRPFAPWLFQVAHHVLVDDSRRAFRAREVLGLREETTPRSDRDPEARAVAAQQADALLAAIPEEQKHVVLGCQVEGKSHAELADELGKSVVAVKQSASRALRRLRGLAAPAEETPTPSFPDGGADERGIVLRPWVRPSSC